jgi:hypothetical protein
MKRSNYFSYSLTVLTGATAMFASLPGPAQQINGTPGSPSATMTLDGKQLPPAPMPFGGVIKESAKDSSPTGRRASSRPRERRIFCSS